MSIKRYMEFIKESKDLNGFVSKDQIRDYFQSLIDETIEFANSNLVDRNSNICGNYIEMRFELDENKLKEYVKELKHIAENIKLDRKDLRIFYEESDIDYSSSWEKCMRIYVWLVKDVSVIQNKLKYVYEI